MIGGWASFGGPRGSYHGSRIAELLPVEIGAEDDRVNSPLVLTVWQRGAGRVGALAPDVMPHRAGGIIDWGEQRVMLPTGNEVGHLYPAFLVDLCRWLGGLT
jgi:hypothetical protein